MRDNSAHREWFDSLVKLLVAVAVVWGGAVSYKEYKARQSEARAARTMEFVEEFYSGEVRAARQRNKRLWMMQLSGWSSFRTAIGSDPEQVRIRHSILIGQLKAFADRAAGDSSESRADPLGVDTVVLFFQKLKSCLDAKLCNERVANEFFSSYGSNFLGLHYPFVEERRSSLNGDFAQSLEELYGLTGQWKRIYARDESASTQQQ